MVIDADPRAFLGAQTDQLLGSLRSADGIHFSATGLEAHAQQWFNALLASGVIVVPEPGVLTLFVADHIDIIGSPPQAAVLTGLFMSVEADLCAR